MVTYLTCSRKLKNCGLANQEKIRWAATQLIILSLLGYRQKCSDKHLLFTIAPWFFSLNQLYSFKVPGAIRYAFDYLLFLNPFFAIVKWSDGSQKASSKHQSVLHNNSDRLGFLKSGFGKGVQQVLASNTILREVTYHCIINVILRGMVFEAMLGKEWLVKITLIKGTVIVLF